MGVAIQGSNNVFPTAATLTIPTLTPFNSVPDLG